MTTYAKPIVSGLSDDVTQQLNDLIQINLDSAEGFRTAAKRVESPTCRELFCEVAMERETQAETLSRVVLGEGESPRETGSLAGKAHRWWLTLRDKVSMSDNYAVLAEAERGEDAIKHLYEEVMAEVAGKTMTDLPGLLREQYVNVKRRHDLVRDLRDRIKVVEKKD